MKKEEIKKESEEKKNSKDKLNRNPQKKIKEIKNQEKKPEENNSNEEVSLKRERKISPESLKRSRQIKIFGSLGGLIVGIISWFFYGSVILPFIFFASISALSFIFDYVNTLMKRAYKMKRMEEVFPDFLQLVAGNLRAGITVDKSILLSSRKEFSPLDEEIARVGKDITTGRSMERSLSEMSERIGSEKIKKTIILITTGLRAGGNLAILLERTASNMRERGFIEKKAASNVLMYEIFILVAVAIGAPGLFSLSTILVEAMVRMMASAPSLSSTISGLNVPFSFSQVGISMTFITYYSIAFILSIGFLSSLVIGLVSKGDEKAGLKYLIPIWISGIVIFLLIRYLLSGFVLDLF